MPSFNPLDYPISLVYPARVCLSAWTKHIPFAMTIVDITRPRIFVELGAYHGASYCAFCQAIAQLSLDTRAYAVDTWKGDEHSGGMGPEILEELRAHHDPRYGGFSRLLVATFDEAREHFNDGSIDLLHIDGYHTYEAVRHDFQSWLPRMSGQGVVLFHDVNVRQADFGVWKLWEELKEQYPSFEFAHHHGLGVLAVGRTVPERLQPFIAATPEETARIREYFHQLGARILNDWENGQRIADLNCVLAQLRTISAEQQACLSNGEQELKNHQRLLAETRDELHACQQRFAGCQRQWDVDSVNLTRQLRQNSEYVHLLQTQLGGLRESLERQSAENVLLAGSVQQLQQDLADIRSSRAFRYSIRMSRWLRALAPMGSWRQSTLQMSRRGVSAIHQHGFKPVLQLFRKTPVPEHSSAISRAA